MIEHSLSMTGRDLILYILANGLEDEPIFKDGTFVGFETDTTYAEKRNVGIATVHTWAGLGMIDFVFLNGVLLIPADSKPNYNYLGKGDIDGE